MCVCVVRFTTPTKRAFPVAIDCQTEIHNGTLHDDKFPSVQVQAHITVYSYTECFTAVRLDNANRRRAVVHRFESRSKVNLVAVYFCGLLLLLLRVEMFGYTNGGGRLR